MQGQNFVRCHQSYLVNGKYITRIAGNQLYLGNEALPISRKYKEQVRQFMKEAEEDAINQ